MMVQTRGYCRRWRISTFPKQLTLPLFCLFDNNRVINSGWLHGIRKWNGSREMEPVGSGTVGSLLPRDEPVHRLEEALLVRRVTHRRAFPAAGPVDHLERVAGRRRSRAHSRLDPRKALGTP